MKPFLIQAYRLHREETVFEVWASSEDEAKLEALDILSSPELEWNTVQFEEEEVECVTKTLV
jgi:hypothetical protein